MDWNKPGSDVYCESTFDRRFIKDLIGAKSVVLIESPYVNTSRLETYRSTLLRLTKRGVRVCVFVQEPWGWDRRGALTEVQDGRLRQMEAAFQALSAMQVCTFASGYSQSHKLPSLVNLTLRSVSKPRMRHQFQESARRNVTDRRLVYYGLTEIRIYFGDGEELVGFCENVSSTNKFTVKNGDLSPSNAPSTLRK
jgi:hypothetical protein